MTNYLARTIVLAAVFLASACDGESTTEPEIRIDAKATPIAEVTPPVSILRPDVTPENAEEQLQPFEATVPFGEGGYALSAEAENVLEGVARSDQFAAGWPIVLRGHTDSTGSDGDNLRASLRRANAVADWLTERGAAQDRIEVIALGEQRPIAPNAKLDGTPDEEGRAKNRRVTVTIAAPIAEQPKTGS